MAPFALPSLPSFPNVKSLINVSPPLVYPSQGENKRRGRSASVRRDEAPASSSSTPQHAWNSPLRGRPVTRAIDRNREELAISQSGGDGRGGARERRHSTSLTKDFYDDDTPTRRYPRHGQQQQQHHHHRPSGSLLASPTLNELEEMQWAPIHRLAHQSSRSTLGDLTPHASPSRPPIHRRSHSALPGSNRRPFPVAPAQAQAQAQQGGTPDGGQTTRSSSSAPMGKLHEVSRYSLASSSAISLPTLLESDLSTAGNAPHTSGFKSSCSRVRSPEEMSIASSVISDTTSHEDTLGYLSSSLSSASSASSPMIKARHRKGSKILTDGTHPCSPISPVSPVSLPSIMPPPLVPGSKAVDKDRNSGAGAEHRRSFSSVPPPQAMRPPPLPSTLNLSGRPQSVSGITRDLNRVGLASGRLRRGSESQAQVSNLCHGMRPNFVHRHSSASTSMPKTTAIVSDVAVMATWSFPPSPERLPVASDSATEADVTAETGTGSMSQPSNRLRQRLRSLSMLDTKSAQGSPYSRSSPQTQTPSDVSRERRQRPLTSGASTPNVSTASSPFAKPAHPALARASTTIHSTPPQPFPRHLTHRHSHSSPSDIIPPRPLIPGQPSAQKSGLGLNAGTGGMRPLMSLPPPVPVHPIRPGHTRRPTTSRLRQPNPLSMPTYHPPAQPSHAQAPAQAILVPVSQVGGVAAGPHQSTGHGHGRVSVTPGSSPGSMISDLMSITSDERVTELDRSSILEGDRMSLVTTDVDPTSSDEGHGHVQGQNHSSVPAVLALALQAQSSETIDSRETKIDVEFTKPEVREQPSTRASMRTIPQLRTMASVPSLSQRPQSYAHRVSGPGGGAGEPHRPRLRTNRSLLSLNAFRNLDHISENQASTSTSTSNRNTYQQAGEGRWSSLTNGLGMFGITIGSRSRKNSLNLDHKTSVSSTSTASRPATTFTSSNTLSSMCADDGHSQATDASRDRNRDRDQAARSTTGDGGGGGGVSGGRTRAQSLIGKLGFPNLLNHRKSQLELRLSSAAASASASAKRDVMERLADEEGKAAEGERERFDRDDLSESDEEEQYIDLDQVY